MDALRCVGLGLSGFDQLRIYKRKIITILKHVFLIDVHRGLHRAFRVLEFLGREFEIRTLESRVSLLS